MNFKISYIFTTFYFINSFIINAQNKIVELVDPIVPSTIVKINPIGAELENFKKNNIEYIWQGSKDFWENHSPILFPIVGRLIDNQYFYEGKDYYLNIHGFASKSNFEIINKSLNSVQLKLKSNSETLKKYPFEFELSILYTLENSKLSVKIEVNNPSKLNNLYFSLGGHPGFNCPLYPDEKRSDYQLIFDKKQLVNGQLKNGVFLIENFEKIMEEPGIIKIKDDLFKNNALIINPNPYDYVILKNEKKNKEIIKVEFKNFPYLGIWSSLNKNNIIAPFVCIEPWYGLTDYNNHNKELKTKIGINKLKPSSKFEVIYSIEILE